jgi:hypothetical protein
MIDLKIDETGDLEISDAGDFSQTDSLCQAVRIRLLWFFNEWRLGPSFGITYFEDVLVKNPNESIIRHLIREAVMDVDEVTNVTAIEIDIDRKTRYATIAVTFTTDEDTFREEVKIKWHSTD